jgi:hypothetical protein
MKGIDALAGLLDVLGYRVGDEFVDDTLQIVLRDIVGDEVNHLFPDGSHL